MKVLIVRTAPNKLDMSTYNLQEIGLAKALARKGHHCDVAYYGGNQKDSIQTIAFEDDKEINVIWLRGFNVLSEGIYPTLGKHIKNYDVVQVGGYVGITATWLNVFAKSKVVNFQGPYFSEYCKGDIKKSKIWDNTLLKLVNKKKMVIGTKSKLASEYMESKGFVDITTIGVGLDLNNLCLDDPTVYENATVKDILGKIKGKTLLYIGTIEDRRNTSFLLDVVKKLKDKNHNEEYTLIIVGKGKDEYVAQCKKKIEENNISENVIWYEKIEQKYLRGIYEAADVFVLPSKYEIYGMVMLESMYFKTPVITTYNGGSSTMLNDNNGVVLDNADADTWAENINELLAHKERYDAMCENAHNTVKECYTWDALADKFIEMYKKKTKR